MDRRSVAFGGEFGEITGYDRERRAAEFHEASRVLKLKLVAFAADIARAKRLIIASVGSSASPSMLVH